MACDYQFDDIQIDLGGFRLYKNGRPVNIEPKALRVLIFLVENRGRLVRKRELMEAVWSDAFVTEQVLSRAIALLRKLLDDHVKSPRLIETVPTLGFRFIAEVSTETTNPAVALDSRAEGIIPSDGEKAARQRAASVGVLPFTNLSTDPDSEFFADGITQDVTAHLAKIRDLKVISRSSMIIFKNSHLSMREMGEKLGAATLVEGSVRRAGDRVRIVAYLVDAVTDEQLWAETYDRDLTDIFAIQTDVALKIAEALRTELTKDERRRMEKWPTHDLDAYELYLRGRDWFWRFNEEGFRRCLIASNAAIARDPNFALAWASIAETQAELCIEGYVDGRSGGTIRKAKEAIGRALDINSDLGEAHNISGFLHLVFDFDWVGAERDFKRAIELTPGSAEAHDYYGWLCASIDRYDDALREVRRAKELNPLRVKSDLANMLLRAGRIEEALAEAQRAVLNEPGEPRCHSVLGWALIFSGDTEAGIASLERSTALAPAATLFSSQLGQACAQAGNVQRAREILKSLHDRAKGGFVSPYHFAYVHTGLGEADAAIDLLETALQNRSGGIYGIRGSFLFRTLREHPRFKALLRKINLA